MLGINKKNINFNIFASKICLRKHLDASWSCHLKTPEEEKVPIVQLGGRPRLKFEYEESAETWLCGVLALERAGWKTVDIHKFSTLHFTYYEESGLGAKVSFVDNKDIASHEITLAEVGGLAPGEECRVSLDLKQFYNNEFKPNKARLLKFIGVNKPHFYISDISLS